MIKIHPQFITDTNGNKSMAGLSIQDFESIVEELEDLYDTQLYDEAKKNDNGERITLSEYLKNNREK